jgi:DNA-3-methyladenine glycosylase
VARQLVGRLIVRRLPDGSRLVGRLVEVEAYLGDGTDPASHSHRGPTPRNLSMFGPPGRIYAYRSYGIHTCINAVCEADGVGAAVLLRAFEPLVGMEAMRRARRLRPDQGDRLIASGPGRLACALSLDLESDGLSALRGELTFHDDEASKNTLSCRVISGPRVGITRGSGLPYRFCIANSPWLSRPARSL